MVSDLTRRYAVFFAGVVCITLGIGIITKGSLGTSPITSIPYSLSMLFPLTIGEFTIMFNWLLVSLQAAMTWSKISRTDRLNLILEYGISVIFGYLVDVCLLALGWLDPTSYPLQILTVLIGILVLAFGVYLQVVANVAMLPGDGFAYALTISLRRSYGKVRVMSDSSMVIAAAVIGLIGLGTLGGVREGTILCCLITGMVAKQYMIRFPWLTAALVPGKDLTTVAEGEKKRCPAKTQ